MDPIDNYESLLWEMPVEGLRELLATGLDASLPDDCGDFLLTVACDRLQVDSVKLLIERDAPLDSKNAEGDTALLCAINVAHHAEGLACEIVASLLDAGADIELRGYMGKPPFLKACSRGCLDVLQLLIARGCDIHATTPLDFGERDDGWRLASMFDTSVEFRMYLRQLYGYP